MAGAGGGPAAANFVNSPVPSVAEAASPLPSAWGQQLALGSLVLLAGWLQSRSRSACAAEEGPGESAGPGHLSADALHFLAEGGIYLPVKLCLLGSTGSGKSALGNFLLAPSDTHIFEEQTFRTGETSMSCTAECKVASAEDGCVLVVDTPGFHESHAKDLGHMLNVAQSLSRLQGGAHAVVLVKKYDARLDQSWRDAVLYYKEFLGKALQDNVIVVLTGCSLGRSRRLKAFGDLQAERLAQTAQEVQALLQLDGEPPVFLLDAMPEQPEAWEASLEARRRILRHCVRRKPVPLEGLRVPKTQPLRQQDEREAGRLEGQIEELEVRVKNLRVFAWSKGAGSNHADLSAAQRDLVRYLQEANNDAEIEHPLDELTRAIEEKRTRAAALRRSDMSLEEAEQRSRTLAGEGSP